MTGETADYWRGWRAALETVPEAKTLLDRGRFEGYAEGRTQAAKLHAQALAQIRAELSAEQQRFGRLFEALMASEAPDVALKFAALQREFDEWQVDFWAKYGEPRSKGGTVRGDKSKAYDEELKAAVAAIRNSSPRLQAMSARSLARHIFSRAMDKMPAKNGKPPSEGKLAQIAREVIYR